MLADISDGSSDGAPISSDGDSDYAAEQVSTAGCVGKDAEDATEKVQSSTICTVLLY